MQSLLAVTEKNYIMERTYIFGGDGNGGGSKLDVNAILPGLMGGRSFDPNLLALMGNRNGFGGQDGWWSIIWLVVIASIFGWNNGGFGGFGGGRGFNGIPAELAGNAGRELLMSAIQGNGNAINQLASSLNCSTQQVQTALCNIQGAISQVGNQVGLTGTQIINALQAGDNNIITQLSSCCCNVLQAIERQGCETRLATSEQTHTLVDSGNENTRAILAKLDAIQTQGLQDKIAALTAQNSTLQAEISQRNQTATILNAVGQQIAPLAAGLQALQGDIEKVKCSLPPTISVPYPTVTAVNTDLYRAAAYGAAAGSYSGGCGYNGGFWG